MAGLQEFTGTPEERTKLETEAKARKAEKQTNYDKMFAVKQAAFAKRPAPSTKLVAPEGSLSGKSMKGIKPSVPSEAFKLSRTGSSPASQARGMEVKARMDALRKAGK